MYSLIHDIYLLSAGIILCFGGITSSSSTKAVKITYEDFKSYLHTVSEINVIASKILEWFNTNICSVVGDVEEAKVAFSMWPKEIQEAVVRGLRAEGVHNVSYTPNAYAMFIKDFFGVYLENPVLYVAKSAYEEVTETEVNIYFSKTLFTDFVRQLYGLTSYIVNTVRRQGVEIGVSKVTEERIERLVEALMQKVVEVTVGVNMFATAVWGLRKILPAFMKRAYEVPEELLRILGFTEIFKAKNTTLWGFSDYFTKLINLPQYNCFTINGVPFKCILSNLKSLKSANILDYIISLKPSTIGGAICMLNEAIWRYMSRSESIISKWFKNYSNLEHVYVSEAQKILEGDYSWNLPQYLKDRYENLWSKVNDDRIYSISSYRYDEEKIYIAGTSIPLTELFYAIMPAIFLGVIDVTTVEVEYRADRYSEADEIAIFVRR
uniref:Uncharacterized protein n=1 Tax=Ignisphaera aggregans TaxID=334771 RepID=A0A7J2U109_9CREN